MANKWYYRHGSTLPSGLVINAPDDNVVGNVVYVDQNHPNASDTAANSGCANVPYITLTKAYTDYTNTKQCIVAKGTYATPVTNSPAIVNADSKFQVILNSEINNITISYYCVLIGSSSSSYGSFNIFSGLFWNAPILYSLILQVAEQQGFSTKSVFISQTLSGYDLANKYNLLYNCLVTNTAATNWYDNVFWLGTLNLNALSSNLTDICARIDAGTITEDQGIAEVEVDLSLAVNTLKNNGFRLLNPHFINITKGNFNIDFLNYDCTAILAIRDSSNWLINRGVRCEYPTDFVGAIGAGFGEEPNLSDSFSGELYSRNINSLGVITNTAYDTVLVSKKYVLPQAYTLENINFFDKLISTAFTGLTATENDGTDTPNCYTYYLIGVPVGTLESLYNSTNYNFNYSGGVLTCDFPLFMLNRPTQLNKVNNTIAGIWENGTYDLDYTRNIFKAGVKEFRIIAVKKGV